MKAIATTLSIAAVAALTLASCGSRDIIKENVENADVQLRMLTAESEKNDTVRIPSTFRHGKTEFVKKTSWVSGFFAGNLWYMYELTGDEFWAEHARIQTENLSEIQYFTGHHDIGFMIYDSYGNGLRLKNIDGYKDVIVNAAKSLSTRFRPNAGIIQSWGADKKRGWTCPVIIDNMMNLELMFKASEFSGDPAFKEIAISHADKTLENHFRKDYSCYHVVDYDPETGAVRSRCTAQGYADESAWSRGQSWALYGYTMMYRFTKDSRYLEQAKNIAHFILNNPNLPKDLVPYWDYDCSAIPDTYRDVSSAAIMASAFYELSWWTGDKAYAKTSDRILESLSTPKYRSAQGAEGGFILMHSVGSIPHGTQIDVPLNYADYYFLEALVRKERIDSGASPVA